MTLRGAVTATLRSRRFWLWQIAGAIIYALPVAYRFATKSVAIPFLNFPGFWIGYYIPGNFLEKLLVNSFFPGGAGGVAGEVFFRNTLVLPPLDAASIFGGSQEPSSKQAPGQLSN